MKEDHHEIVGIDYGSRDFLEVVKVFDELITMADSFCLLIIPSLPGSQFMV